MVGQLKPLRAWVRRAVAVARRAPGRPDLPAETAPGTHAIRPAIVPASLADLRGPTSGTVALPTRLSWSLEDHDFDLADRDDRLDAYSAVLGAARSLGDITGFLDASLLRDAWPDLSISRAIRRRWEGTHPELAPAPLASSSPQQRART